MKFIIKSLIQVFVEGHRSVKSALVAYLTLAVSIYVIYSDHDLHAKPVIIVGGIVISVVFFIGGCLYGKRRKKNN